MAFKRRSAKKLLHRSLSEKPCLADVAEAALSTQKDRRYRLFSTCRFVLTDDVVHQPASGRLIAVPPTARSAPGISEIRVTVR